VQVNKVGGGYLREVVDFRDASRAEMECWVAQEQVYGALRGATHPVGTLARGLTRWWGGWRHQTPSVALAWSASGARPAIAQYPARVGEVAELRVPCLLAAGGGLKRQVARGRWVVYNLIICVQRVVCVLVVLSPPLPSPQHYPYACQCVYATLG